MSQKCCSTEVRQSVRQRPPAGPPALYVLALHATSCFKCAVSTLLRRGKSIVLQLGDPYAAEPRRYAPDAPDQRVIEH